MNKFIAIIKILSIAVPILAAIIAVGYGIHYIETHDREITLNETRKNGLSDIVLVDGHEGTPFAIPRDGERYSFYIKTSDDEIKLLTFPAKDVVIKFEESETPEFYYWGRNFTTKDKIKKYGDSKAFYYTHECDAVVSLPSQEDFKKYIMKF